MPVEESRQILKTPSLCRWEHAASAAMLAGWVALAPVCGAFVALPAWIVGGAGSGKSTVLSNFVKPLLGEMETSVLAPAPRPGSVSIWAATPYPCLWMRPSKAQARDEERLQTVMELARASSSETGAKTLKGTASGTRGRSI